MTRIHCLTTFLDDRDRFEAGETRIVEDDRAARFIAAGWASADGTSVIAHDGSQTLDVHSVTHSQEVTHG